MSEENDISLGKQQPTFTEAIASVRAGDRNTVTVDVEDGVTVRVQHVDGDSLDISIRIAEELIVDDDIPTLGQNTIPRLVGDIVMSLKSVYKIPAVVEPDFERREETESDDTVVYSARIDIDHGVLS